MSLTSNNFSGIQRIYNFSTYRASVVNANELNLGSSTNNNFSSSIGPTGSNGSRGTVGYTGSASAGFVSIFGGKSSTLESYLIYNSHKDSPTDSISKNKNIFILPVDSLLTYITYTIQTPKPNALMHILTNNNLIVTTISGSNNSGNLNINPYFFAKGSECQILVSGAIINDTNVTLYFS
jgi:hypothetical protein